MVRRILQAVPPRFDQIAHSIEMLLDVDDMTVEELVGRLKSAEVRDRSRNLPAATNSNGKLLLSEEEWLARYKHRLAGESSRSNGNSGKPSGGNATATTVARAQVASRGDRRPGRTSASTAARRATGPVNVARRSAMRRRSLPRPAAMTTLRSLPC